ncbi:hypothetical protein [Microbacterium sp.]|uniref:hypothetical protein n=1 Tax=Microbacterium sp. TaxID=51671 RepID=UPI00391B8B0A
MPGIRPFDARALQAPTDRAAAKAFTARLRAEGRLPGDSAATVVAFVIAFVALGGVGLFLVALLAAFSSFLREGAVILGILFVFPLVLGVGALVAALLVGRRGRHAQEERRWRLDRFARDVGLEYLPAVVDPPLPGVIFGLGGGRVASDVLRGREPRFVEMGNHSYTVSNGKNTQTVRWGYIAIRLDVPLPHIVLDATANDGVFGSNLPASWGRGQRLSLEGDFDRHFRLFCPEGYERDALYLFTPDVMARFIDSASVLDVEIVDDWMLLFSREELSTTDPARWGWVFSVISALLDKLDQWARWRDDRMPAALPPATVPPAIGGGASAPVPQPGAMPARPQVGVAPPGRRLRRTNPWVVVGIVLGVLGLGGLLITVGPLLFLLSV